MARKYATTDTPREDISEILKCAKRGCKWQGTEDERKTVRIKAGYYGERCPSCGNDDFYRVLKKAL